MPATLLPNAETQFVDNNGKPLAGGSVYFYIPNTTTFKSTWQDSAQTILNTNPVILDGGGRAIIWGSGTYRQQVYDVHGNLIWDQITQDANSSLIGTVTDAKFVSGTDFTPGTTTTLNLPVSPGSIANTWIFFDAAYQADDQVASLNGTVLTFTAPIPVGVQEVNIKIGTTVAIGTPANGSITDAMLAPGSKVLNRVNDLIDVVDFGAVGNGTTDDTTAMNHAISSAPYNFYPNRNFAVAGNYTLPFPKTIWTMPGEKISTIGSGTTTLNGVQIQFGYNPDGITSWTTTSGHNYEGLSVDFGGYGPRTNQGIPINAALNGSINIPSSATVAAHAAGVSGYAKSASTTTAAVPLFGWGESLAPNALAWGINTVTKDNNFATTIWGYEIDINIDNPATNVRALDITGGSSTTGNITEAIRIGPIGTFTNPALPFGTGLFIDDGSAVVGINVGTAKRGGDTGSFPCGSMPINIFWNNNSGARTLAGSILVDNAGNLSINNPQINPLLSLQCGANTGVSVQWTGVIKLSFYGATPVAKPTVTGAKGGNAALASLMTALSSLGLVIDSTTS